MRGQPTYQAITRTKAVLSKTPAAMISHCFQIGTAQWAGTLLSRFNVVRRLSEPGALPHHRVYCTGRLLTLRNRTCWVGGLNRRGGWTAAGWGRSGERRLCAIQRKRCPPFSALPAIDRPRAGAGRNSPRNPDLGRWLADLEPALGIGWVADPRPPALYLQAPMRLRPRLRATSS